MTITLIILAVSAFLFVLGKVRADLVALSALLALILAGVLTPQEALSGFSNPIVIMIAGAFVIGGAVSRTGLAKMLSRRILGLAKTSGTRLFILIMLVTATIGAFVSNAGTVAVMMPIVISLAASANASSRRFLMPLAYASMFGGMLTLIGTTSNMIVSSALVEAGYPALRFFAFLPIGLICVVLGTTALFFLSKYLLKSKERGAGGAKRELSLQDLMDKYRIQQNEYWARVRSDSPLIGKDLSSLHLRERFDIAILGIQRRDKGWGPLHRPPRQIWPKADTKLCSRDIFSFVGPKDKILTFAASSNLDLIAGPESKAEHHQNYLFTAIGLAELVILSTSRLIDRTVLESDLRENYGVRVLGLQRKGTLIIVDATNEKIKAGDELLVQGEWKDIARLNDEPNEWVVVGQPMTVASRETLDYKAPLAGLIIVAMILAMTFNVLVPVTAILLAALALVFTGCFKNVEEAYKTIGWQSVVLVAAMLPMSLALQKTGAAGLASHYLINVFGGLGPYALLAVVYAFTSLSTLFISNTATAALYAPVAIQVATLMHVSPYPFIFAVATAASLSLAAPFSSPGNILVMTPGRYSVRDYIKVGGPLQMLLGIVMVLTLPLLFPFAR